MKRGTVTQRHTNGCPRDEDGRLSLHKCHGPWAYYLVAGRDQDGKRRQFTQSGFRTKRLAETALRDLLSRADAEIAEIHELTVEAYLEQWLAGKLSLRAGTLNSYRSHLRLYLIPHLGDIKLGDLRPQHLDRMYAALLDGPRSATTVRRVHATLRSALNLAVRRRLITWNPSLHIELPTVPRPQTNVWTPEQLGTFLDGCMGDPMYPLMQLVTMTGLRRGEALGLRWMDVDLDGHLLHVRQQLVDTGKGLAFGPPKTRSGTRSVPLDTMTVDALRDLRRQQDLNREAWDEAWIDLGLVFTRENGDLIRPDYLSHRFVQLASEIGLPRIRLHDLRHSSASAALAAGVAMKTVSERLGHSTTTITADLYTHVVPMVAMDAAQRIADAVPRKPGTQNRAKSSESLAREDKTDS